MSAHRTRSAVGRLLDDAADLYRDDPEALALLEGYRQRLEEPLRLAIGGMVKAGKSTLLNAMVGDRIAPTDAGECTTVVTWYRYGHSPRIRLHRRDGSEAGLPVHRVEGRLDIRLDGEDLDAVEKVVVSWPAAGLRDLTIVDTPGIASLSADVSARSARFLVPDGAPSQVDALLYLVRQLHATDLDFLRSFHDKVDGGATVSSIAVLSRADEIGGGRLDSLLSARGVAERYRRDDDLGGFALGILPLAGLLAQSARTLREAEYVGLAALARMDRPSRERLLVSADRFAAADIPEIPPKDRAALLERFGLFGIRLAAVLLRDGSGDSTFLAHELARRSGLDDVLHAVDELLVSRAPELKARSALKGVELMLEDRPRPGTDELARRIDGIRAGEHELAELTLLARARTTGLPLPPRLRVEAARLLGGRGSGAVQRLGIREQITTGIIEERARSALHRWKTLKQSPLISRDAARTCDAVIRSCEGILADCGAVYPAWRGASSSPRNQPAASGNRADTAAIPASAN